LRAVYATAFEIDTSWVIEAAARRQKWIDQAQSLNIYMAGVSGKKLDETYKLAWQRGLKTTYYLRTLAATSAEKSTGKGGELNSVSSGVGTSAPAGAMSSNTVAKAVPKPAPAAVARAPVAAEQILIPPADIAGPVCMLKPGDAGFEDCEACQ